MISLSVAVFFLAVNAAGYFFIDMKGGM